MITRYAFVIQLTALLFLLLLSCRDEDTPLSNSADITSRYKIPATLDSLSKKEAYFDDTITVYGYNIVNYLASKTYVKVDTVEVTTFIKSSTKEVTFVIPENVSFGTVKVIISVNDTLSNALNLKILSHDYQRVDMILVPSGSFFMGDAVGKGFANELPVHKVNMTKPFWMGKYEITQSQWLAFVSNNPSVVKGNNYPVYGIDWVDAVLFCNMLSEKENLSKCYNFIGGKVVCDFDAGGYRLPTEAEWEYACRAGSSGDYSSGNSEENLKTTDWYKSNDDSVAHPVGEKIPNTFGLYDMQGNVSEYCWDWWAEKFDSTEVTNPFGPAEGFQRVIRGGAWNSNAISCRSCFRYYFSKPDMRSDNTGLRVVKKN